MSKNLFESVFKHQVKKELKTLNENTLEDELGGGVDDLGADENELAAQMEDDVDAVDPNEARQQQDASNAVEIQDKIAQKIEQDNDILSGWVNKLDEFLKFVNDPATDGSIRSVIDNSIEGSVFQKIKTSENRRITRVATEVAAFTEAIKSYIGSSDAGDIIKQ